MATVVQPKKGSPFWGVMSGLFWSLVVLMVLIVLGVMASNPFMVALGLILFIPIILGGWIAWALISSLVKSIARLLSFGK